MKYYPATYFCNFCIYCGQEITWQTWYYGNKACKSCSAKIQFNKKHCYCVDCDKEIRCDNRRCRKCMGKIYSIERKEKGNPNWQNGISFELYTQEFNNELKEKIRQRDNYTCQLCGKTQKQESKTRNRKLSVHHIDYDKENCDKSNLITLCSSCNSKVNRNRDYWFAYFTYIMENKEK